MQCESYNVITMKNSYLITICLFLLIGQRGWGESVTKTVHFSHSELKIDTITGEDGEGYEIMSYPGTGTEVYPGFPTLPVKFITISLPYAADDIIINTQCSKSSSHLLNKKIFPVQEPEATSIVKTEKIFTPCENSVYNSSLAFPSEQAKITEISCAGYGDRNVVVTVYPAVYYPIEDRYVFSEDIEITLSYNYSSQRSQAITRGSQTTDIGIPFYEYCVITSQNLKAAFTRLIAWKREKGLYAGVVCKEDILNNAHIIGDTVSSIYDDAGKIRQYLQYAYLSGATKYVLFGGNDQILPIRYGTGNSWPSNVPIPESQHIPSDLYFSELNMDWDIDNDLNYGESIWVADYGSELSVGRLLCTNTKEIQNYTDKLLRYELNPGNGDYSYLRKALYTQEDQMQSLHEQDSIAHYLHDIFPIDTIFSELPSYNDDAPTAPFGNDIIAEMNKHYGYVSWGGHGHPNAISVKSNGNHKSHNYAITSVQGNIPYIVQESANGLDNLTNKDYPMFAYSVSCDITPFDTYAEYTEFPNIGQSFTLGKDYGGPVLIGNTRSGYHASSIMQMKFNEYLIEDPMVGHAQNYARQNTSIDNIMKCHLNLTSNIIGCPNVRVWTDIPTSFSATLCYNPNNYVVSANSSVTDAVISVRDITQTEEVIDTISFNPSQGSKTLTNVENCLVTLTGKNCLPQILPLTIQNATLQGSHYAIVKDVICGRDVREGTHGNITFEETSDYTFETKGTFKLTKGVEIKKGAQLKVMPSEINY